MSHSRSHSVASSSSLEIIDDEELRNVMEEERQISLQDPTNQNSIEEIVQGLENTLNGISVAHVNPQQVVFEDVKDTYTDAIEVRVESKGDDLNVGDVVGIFQTPFLDIKECLSAAQITIDDDSKLKGSAELTRLDVLTGKEFYQFQYLRQANNTNDGKILHTICGASVPWQFVKSNTHVVKPEGSTSTWDMEKYSDIERQIWSPNSSRLTEICIAEQIKKFIFVLDPAIQVRFITHLMSQVKSDPALYKSCSVYSKMFRIFHLLGKMEIKGMIEQDQAGIKNINQLIKSILWKIRSEWDADYALAEYDCYLTGKLGCRCNIYELLLFESKFESGLEVSNTSLSQSTVMVSSKSSTLSASSVSDQDEKERSVLSGWSSASVLQRNSSSKTNSSSVTSADGSSLQDQVSELKKENEGLKKVLECLDSSIQVLEADKLSAQNSLTQMSQNVKFEADLKNIFQQDLTKANNHLKENNLNKIKLQGELSVVKKTLDKCVKDKADMCGKLEDELKHREDLIDRIEQLEAAQDNLEQEKFDLLECKEKLRNELLHVNQMLEAAQMSKEAAATLSREQASQLSQQHEVTQESSTGGTLSWVQCNEDSIPDGVDKDLVKVFSSMGIQLEEARAKIKQLEDALRAKDLELKESLLKTSCTEQVGQETIAEEKEKIKTDVEAEVSEKMKALEMKSQEAVKALETRTMKLESVQDELKRFMDNNMEQMSHRLSLLAEENKSCEMKIQKLESYTPSEDWTGDRDGSLSVSSRGSLASSCASNMNSIKIASELSNNTRRDDAALSKLREYFLPDPLVPEKLETDPGIPELRRREPSRYSMSSSSLEASNSSTEQPHWLNKEDGKCMFCEEFVSQVEDHICGKETEMDKAHKKQKDLLKKDVPFCPICFITFDKSKENELSGHVNSHFQDQSEDSFLHLGID